MKMNTSPKVIGIEGYRKAAQQDKAPVDIARLALKLQQTLEITPLMHLFCNETAMQIPCDSVSYKSEKGSFNYHTGDVSAHKCRYQLELEGISLGEIECTRSKPFSIKETDMIERLLGLLIYPLRNATLYQKAIAEAFRDPLTQIGNRGAFDDALNREIYSHNRHATEFSLMVIDIDFFKKVNDTHGHIAGDSVLKEVAQIIRQTIRRSDEVFRYGGEEFVVILSKTQSEGAQFIAERVRKEIKKLTVKAKEQIKVTASIGVCSTNKISDVNDIVYHADKALYQAKEEGRDRVIARP